MSQHRASPPRSRSAGAGYVALVVAILAALVYLLLLAIFETPELGFQVSPRTWEVLRTELECEAATCLQRDDRVISIGPTTVASLVENRWRGLDPGPRPVRVVVERDGARLAVDLAAVPSSPTRRVARALTMVVPPVSFWLAGGLALLLLRPLRLRAALYALLFSLLSLFFAASWSAWSQVGGSWYWLRGTLWCLVAVLPHFHAVIAELPWFTGRRALGLYAAAALGIGADLGLYGRANLVGPALLVAILASLVFLGLGLRRGSHTRRRACRIMFLGLALGSGPLLVGRVLPTVAPALDPGASASAEFLFGTLAALTIPLWPLSYLYAVQVFSRQEPRFRANRQLGLLSYMALVLTVYLLLQIGVLTRSVGDSALSWGVLAPTLACGFLLLVAPSLRRAFQRWVDRNVFGLRYEPEAVLRHFARRIPSVTGEGELRQLLLDELLPTLMIRSSSLFILKRREARALYVDSEQSQPSADFLHRAANRSNVAAMRPEFEAEANSWIRLVLPISADRKIVGIWLLGDRDPDDTYSSDDVQLLEGLAGMVGAVLRGQRSSEFRTKLLAAVSHEMRTPLLGIQGSSELLGSLEDLDPRVRERLDSIDTSCRRLRHHVDNLLDLASSEPSSTALLPRRFGLQDLLDRVVRDTRERTEAQGLSLQLEAATVQGEFVGPDQAIHRILEQLLDNAIRFTPEGRIVLGVKPDEQRAGFFRFSVKDSGVGIPGGELKSIFEAFSESGSHIAKPSESLGLGLAVCRHLAAQFGGTLGVDSEQGVGSHFWLDVPLEVPSRRQAEGPTADSAAPFRKPPRVLVAEDDPVNVHVIGGLLDQLGFHYEIVGNGAEAVDRVARSSFDLVLMDCRMPVMEGTAATREIRRREAETGAARMPIVGFTAYSLQEDIDRCYRAGMDDVLVKPTPLDELREALTRAARQGNDPSQ